MAKKKKVLFLLSMLPKGHLRAQLLKNDKIRSSVLNSGANVTIYTGKVKENADTVAQCLQDIHVGLIQRKNKRGNFDGLGALGGLAERTDEMVFLKLPPAARLELAKMKDDVIVVNGVAQLTTDIDIIRKNNVLREMKEELSDLGIRDKSIDSENLELISMPKVKDDNYMINIWDGKGECYAITPYCHIYHDNTGIIDEIVQNSKEQAGGEVSEYKKVPLLKALQAYGTIAGEHKLEDGRNAVEDYRYPHEYLACWALASKLLDNDDKKMVELAMAVQGQAKHQISFSKIAKATSQSMEDMAKVLNISIGTLNKMENCMQKVYQSKENLSPTLVVEKTR